MNTERAIKHALEQRLPICMLINKVRMWCNVTERVVGGAIIAAQSHILVPVLKCLRMALTRRRSGAGMQEVIYIGTLRTESLNHGIMSLA